MKVKYHGEEMFLEPLDADEYTLDSNDDLKEDIENTMKIKKEDIEKTIKMKSINLEDTLEFNGD